MDRSCGSCYACCVWLSIEALHKYTGQTCKHLTGTNGPEHRCSIYTNRPAACSSYHCLWREGSFTDNDRPNNSGLLASGYPARHGGPFAVTIVIIDEAKAGNLYNGNVYRFVSDLLRMGCHEIMIANYFKNKAVLIDHGKIYEGWLKQSPRFEEHIFEGDDRPIATYEIFESTEDAEAWSAKNPAQGIRIMTGGHSDRESR